MILVNEMPKSGQFVAVWEYNGNIWSGTYYWDDGGDLFEWGDEGPLEIRGYHDIFPEGVRYCKLKAH